MAYRRVLFAAALILVQTWAASIVAAPAAAPDPDIAVVAESSNQFAWEMYPKLAATNSGNLFYSPPSITTALAMTSAGARGDTAVQMVKVLHLDHLSAKHSVLIRQFNEANKNHLYQLNVVNRLWGQQGYEFLPAFVKTLRDDYDAELEQVDFATQPEQARQTINTWISQATNGKISELMPSGSVVNATKLVVTDAVYFKGNWQEQFKKEQTQPAPFFVTPFKKVEAPMMTQQQHYRYGTAQIAEGQGLKVLELPYKGNELAMVILLPDQVDGVQVLDKQLTAENLKKWTAHMDEPEVRVWLPRFKLSAGFMLEKVLSEMGMPLAFEPDKADFSGMDGKRDLFISSIVHKTYLDVDEEGTEAAAATGTSMNVMARPANPAEFRADHPFVFFIRDNRTGCILFLGRLNDPGGTEIK